MKSVLTKGGCHPERARKSKTDRIRSQKRPISDIIDIQEQLAENNPKVKIVAESYVGKMKEAVFIDEDFGEFTRRVRDVIDKKQRHPEFHRKKKSQLARARYEKAKESWITNLGVPSPFHDRKIQDKCKESFQEKYGVSSIGSSEEIRERITRTNLERYGHEYLFQDKEFRQKCFEISQQNGRCSGSIPEQEIRDFLESNGVEVKKRRFWSEKRQKYLEFDIVCEDLKVAIEMNGLYYHSERFLDKHYHLDKLKLAQSLGLRLIMLWDYEWCQRQDQAKNFILSALNKNPRRYGARQTQCREIPKKQARDFLEQNHLQGAPRFETAFGLFSDEELLMVISIGRHHRRSQEFVLSRMCAGSGVTVAGGFSKLVREALKRYPVLYSWVDLRISTGHSYEKSGWECIDQSGPDYFYTDHRKIISKQSRKKNSVRTPAGETEREHALRDGLLRVWDCGKKKFKVSS